MDLHAIIKSHGIEAVAESIGCTASTLRRKRAGIRPLTIEELHRLAETYPEFDVAATVARIGGKRDSTSK